MRMASFMVCKRLSRSMSRMESLRSPSRSGVLCWWSLRINKPEISIVRVRDQRNGCAQIGLSYFIHRDECCAVRVEMEGTLAVVKCQSFPSRWREKTIAGNAGIRNRYPSLAG